MAMRKGVLTKGMSPKMSAFSRKASSKSPKVSDSFGYVSFNLKSCLVCTNLLDRSDNLVTILAVERALGSARE